jgi:Cd2+/Zn2+-exporting ATPase
MKKRLWRIIIGTVVCCAAVAVRSQINWLPFLLFLFSYLIIGSDVLLRAIKNIKNGNFFDENFLMGIATIGAFFIGEFPEGVAVMLFYQVGELFQSYAVFQSRKSITSLMDIRPDYANVEKDGKLLRTDPDEIWIGDIIVVKAGEKVPVDGKVISGTSTVDTSALTGESLPRDIEPGSDLLSGCINLSGVIKAKVTKEYSESEVSKILDMVENASSKKSKPEQFITRFARYYTPVVVIIAVLLAFIPPLINDGMNYKVWIYRALSFLVVSCPCALVISIPLSFFGGIGGASKRGILIKGGNYLEALAKTEVIVFDKTGTLTKGIFEVQSINPKNITRDKLLEITAYAESYSNHPISLSLKRAYGREINNHCITKAEELTGYGVDAIVDGQSVIAGNSKLMKKLEIPYDKEEPPGTIVHVSVNGEYAGYIVIADEVKEDSAQAIKELKAAGIRQTVMLTGDNARVGSEVAGELYIDQVYTQLMPADKVEKVEALLMQKSKHGRLAYVGDGINDAPVLMRADIGIAMGGLGSDAAIEAADIVIMTDEPIKIPTAIRISKKTLAIAYQNIIFAIGIKIVVLILIALGFSTMWAAVFADVGVAIIAILNSFRAMNVKKL